MYTPEKEREDERLVPSPSEDKGERQTWCDYLTCNCRRLYCSRGKRHVRRLQFDEENPFYEENPERDKNALQKLKF